MLHGQIEHGYQLAAAGSRSWPTSYYGPNSGVALALCQHPKRLASGSGPGLRIGVIGLGCGTLATYAQANDLVRFYEINPAVIRMAREHFSFLSDCRGTVEIVEGDARLELEREAAAGQPLKFDVLVVDAFSGDSIPMHLLTRECLRLYRRHLAPEGLVCLHLSNKHLDLTGVARGHALEMGLTPLLFESPAIAERGVGDATWVVLCEGRTFADVPSVRSATSAWLPDAAKPLVWTDDFGSLRQVLR
jgi:hypothetical protein